MKGNPITPVVTVDSLRLAAVFFGALQYPSYARPDYFIQKQKASGWSKGVYLTTLNEIYHSYITRLQIHYHAQKKNTPGLRLEDVELDIEGTTVAKKVDKKILDELHLAVRSAWYIGRPEPIFSPYQILTFVEAALIF